VTAEDGSAPSGDVVVVSNGLANVGSVVNMCRRLGVAPTVTSDPSVVETAERVLLPGVGAFDVGMAALVEAEVDTALRGVVEAGRPVLGICLGMQLLFEESEEGTSRGLGLIPGTVKRLSDDSPFGPVRVPHMGWSRIVAEREHPLLEGLEADARYYFVHSFAAEPADPGDVIGTSVHGNPFASAVARGCVAGVQFHPEKSHRYGKALLSNFLGLTW